LLRVRNYSGRARAYANALDFFEGEQINHAHVVAFTVADVSVLTVRGRIVRQFFGLASPKKRGEQHGAESKQFLSQPMRIVAKAASRSRNVAIYARGHALEL